MELRKIGGVSANRDDEICRHADRIRNQLGSALRLVDQIAEAPMPIMQNDPVTEKTIRTLIKLRRKRDQFFGPDLFADPAWDILLELYLSKLSQQRMPVTSLCVGAAVPASTALRWIVHLQQKGFISRRQNPMDRRRVFVSLTHDGRARIDDYFRTVPTGVPLI